MSFLGLFPFTAPRPRRADHAFAVRRVGGRGARGRPPENLPGLGPRRYLPWVLLAFSVLLGNPATTDLVGIAVGHAYYYLEYVYPRVAEIRGFRVTRVLAVPESVRRLTRRRPRGGLADQVG